MEAMSTSQNYDDGLLDIMLETESEEQRMARLNRLRAAEIKRRLKTIDGERIRPLAAIVSNKATEYDSEKLTSLENEAEALRKELSELGGAI
jgi:hypothetical protein